MSKQSRELIGGCLFLILSAALNLATLVESVTQGISSRWPDILASIGPVISLTLMALGAMLIYQSAKGRPRSQDELSTNLVYQLESTTQVSNGTWWTMISIRGSLDEPIVYRLESAPKVEHKGLFSVTKLRGTVALCPVGQQIAS